MDELRREWGSFRDVAFPYGPGGPDEQLATLDSKIAGMVQSTFATAAPNRNGVEKAHKQVVQLLPTLQDEELSYAKQLLRLVAALEASLPAE